MSSSCSAKCGIPAKLCLPVDSLLISVQNSPDSVLKKPERPPHPDQPSRALTMKHRSPAKLIRSIKRITKFLERKVSTSVLPVPVTVQDPPAATQITFKEFESWLKSQNESMIEQRRQERLEDREKRRQERLEDIKKLNLLLGLPT